MTHHKRRIRIHHHTYLDPNPARGLHTLFVTFEGALRELQAAVGKTMVMAELRALLPTWLMPALMNDHQVVHHVATQVAQGKAAIKTTPAAADDLPWTQILADLERFEGNVPHMYVDSKGYVTVGVGKMLPNATEAKKLGFVVRATKAPATPDQIAADFAKVQAQPMNHLPSFYKSDLDLPQSEVDRITKEIAQRCDKEVAARYTGYDDYPVEVKQVLIDMRFNMGGNMDKFKNFKKAIETAHHTGSGKDWETAAKESYRRDVGAPDAGRNLWARDMILKGGGVAK